jgi:hypothetical protein
MYVSVEKCPHCGKMIDFSVRGGGPWSSKLGAKTIYHCPSCRGAISDGMMEWSEMGTVDRIAETAWWSFFILIVSPLLGILCAGLVGYVANKIFGGFAYLDPSKSIQSYFSELAIFGVVFSLLALGIFIKEIRASKRRAPKKVKGFDPRTP